MSGPDAPVADLRFAGMTPAQAALGVIALGSAARLAMALTLGLGIDESYMVAAGRAVRLGYFDHPPLAWWLSAGMARLAGTEAGWVLRLPFIALFAVSTWLAYRLGAATVGPRAGAWAAALLNLSPVFGVTTGGWILPDGPLDCALLAAALCLVRALRRGDGGGWGWWLGAGAAAGAALLSKYSAALTLAGAFAYLATQPTHRAWLRRPQPYAALGVAALAFAPALLWNARHGWASLAFQAGRVGGEGLRPWGPLLVLGGEALFLLPWLWLPMMLAAWRALRAGPSDGPRWLLLCLGAGPVALFAVVGLWSRHVLYHWAAPGYLMWFPLMGLEADRLRARWPRAVRGALLGTCALLAAGLAALGGEVRWHWLPASLTSGLKGADPELQAVDWTALAPALAERGLLGRPGAVIGALGWQDAGKIGYALPGQDVICLHRDARQFGFVAAAERHWGADVVLLATRPLNPAALAEQGYAFDSIAPLPDIPLAPGERPTLRLLAYLGQRLRRAP